MDEKMLDVLWCQRPVEYGVAYGLQKELWWQRVTGRTVDTLLLLEHPPTFTIGKSGSLENLLLSREELARSGISLFFTDRGGDITYHGPGQLVAYLIIDLRNRGKDIHRYIRSLEEVVIRVLADLSIEGRRDGQNVGVWVGSAKIAAIGVSVRRWVTRHGLALNVNPDLEHFARINPCGLRDGVVTSIAKLLSRPVSVGVLAERLVSHFADVFSVSVQQTLVR